MMRSSMKKILTILLWGMLTSINLYAGGRFVLVEYKHSRRIPHNEITIELRSENNNDKIFYAKLLIKNMDQKSENLITERVMSIEKEYFDAIYNRILDLNLKEINEPPRPEGRSLSDILCKWRRIIRTEPVLFRTQWRTGLTPAPNPLPA
jgi:hypothetical protein